MKTILFTLSLLIGMTATAQDSAGKLLAYCSSVEHHGVDLDIFVNTSNDIIVRATGGDGYANDHLVTNMKTALGENKMSKKMSAFILEQAFKNQQDDRLEITLDAASLKDSSKLSLTVGKKISLNINGYSQDTWCKPAQSE